MYVDFQHSDLSNQESGLQETLHETFHFDESDLEFNKSGKLSTPQMTRLLFQALGPFFGLLGTAVSLGVLCIGLWVAGPLSLKAVRIFGKYLFIGLGAAFFGVIGLIVRLLITSGRVVMLIPDLMEGKVATVSGRMNTSKSEEIEDGLSTFTRQKTSRWNCVIKGEYFEIDEEGFAFLQDRSGSNFKAYLTPRSRFMVAIEPAGPEENARDPFKFKS